MPVDFEEDVQDFGFEPEEETAPVPSMQPMFVPEPIALKPPASLPNLAAWQKAIAGGPTSPRTEELSQFQNTAKLLAEGRGESVSPEFGEMAKILEYGGPTAEQRLMSPHIPIHQFSADEIKKWLPRDLPGAEKDPKKIDEIAGRAAAVLNTAKGFAEFMESPVGISTLGLGATASPIVNRVLALMFAADAARRVPESARRQAEIETTGTPQEKWEGRLGLLTEAGIAGLGGKGGIAPKGRIIPPGMPEGTMEVPVTTGILREAERNLVRGPITAKEAIALAKPTPRTPEELPIKQAVPKAEPEAPAPKTEAAPEPAAPSIREQAEAILTMPSEELKAYKGGATGLAWDVGAKARTAEDVAILREVAEKASAEGKALMKQGKFNEAMALAGRQPAEAYEYATGVKLDGTPKWETLEKLIPDYKPPVPDAKYLDAKGIKPTTEPSVPVPVPESESKSNSLITSAIQRENVIYLSFDITGNVPKPYELESMFKQRGHDVDVVQFEPNVMSTSEGVVKFEIRAFDPEGRYSTKVAKNAFRDVLGQSEDIQVKSRTSEALPFEERFRKTLETYRKMETGESAKKPAKPVSVSRLESAEALGITTPGGRMVMDAFNRVNNTRQALGSIFKAGSERRLMDQTMDAADNQAHIAGAQARKSLDIGTTPLDRQAAMAIVETNGNRARLADFLRQATGKNDEAVRAVNHAIDNWDRLQPLAQRTRNLLDHQIASENAAGINTEFREAYVPHIYDMDLLMGQGRPYVISGSGKGTATGFKKGRTFDTVFDAIEAGYTPKTLDVGQLVEHRVKVGQRLMNRKGWAEGLKTVNDPSTGMPLVTELERKQRGPGGTWYETAPLGYTPREIIPGVRIAVHEGYAPLFDALTGTSRISGSLPGKALLEAAGGIKHGLLLFDTFHVSRILQKELFLTGRVGYKKGLSLLEYSDADLGRAVQEGLITQDMADYARTNRADAQLLIKNGLNVGRIQEALYTSIVRQIKGLGTFNKWVFEKMTRGAMMESGLIELERVQAARPDLTREQAAQIVARDLNTYFGNLGRQGLFKSQTAQDMARLVALAPQWVESMARSEAKGAYQLGKGLTYDPLVHKSIMVGSLGKGLGQGLLAYFIGTQLLNLATRHQFTWQNEEKDHKLDAWIPDVTGKSKGFFISPFSVVAELTHDMIRYAHSEGNKLDAAIRIASNKASPLVRAGKILLTGRTFGKEYVKDPWDRAKTAAVSLAPAPIPAQPLIRGQARPGDIQRQLTASLGFKTEAAPTAAEQMSLRARDWMKSIGRESETEILQTPDAPYKRLRHAIRMGNDAEARDAIGDLKKTRKSDEILQAMRHSENAPFTGSLRWEKVFKRSLTPEEMGIYVRAAQERKLDHAKFMNLWRGASR